MQRGKLEEKSDWNEDGGRKLKQKTDNLVTNNVIIVINVIIIILIINVLFVVFDFIICIRITVHL